MQSATAGNFVMRDAYQCSMHPQFRELV